MSHTPPASHLFRSLPALALLSSLAFCPMGQGAESRPVAVTAGVPKRVVSLMPSLTETVCAIGACDRLVGTDRHSDWPLSVGKLPKVGGMEDASVESILALRPDLVLARSNSRVVPRLQELGVRVLLIDIKTHAEMRKVMEQVAVILGRPGAGEAAWQQVERDMAAAVSRVPASWRGAKVYVEVHGGAAGASESSFIGETLTRLGLRNIVPGEMGPFPKLGPEFVMRARPDMVVTSGVTDPVVVAARPGWSAMDAIRLGRNCSLDNMQLSMLMRPGPRLGESVEALVSCMKRFGDRTP